jgi:hypothetical protein
MLDVRDEWRLEGGQRERGDDCEKKKFSAHHK